MPEANQTPEEQSARIAELEARIHEYHRSELTRWARVTGEAQLVFDELERMRLTVSWRVTAPLRVVRRRQLDR
jgi:hypothetical protein